MNIITVDAGKFQTKGLHGSNGVRFRTKMEEVDNNIQVNVNNNNHHIQWDGKHYVIGDSARYVDYNVSKHKLQHKLATYIACTELIKDKATSPVNFMVLSPLALYTNIQAREGFRQFILNNNKAKFELNGKEVELEINDVTIFAEAIGVPMSNVNKFKNKTVGLFDIGGLNVNGVVIKDMKPVKDTHFTENLGSLIIMDKIRKELNKEIKGTNIQEYQMDSILKQGYYPGDADTSREIINSLLADHFREILQVAKASNWDTKGLDVVVAGGGSIDLGLSNIQSHIPQAQMSNNPIWDSCIGGNKVGEVIYG